MVLFKEKNRLQYIVKFSRTLVVRTNFNEQAVSLWDSGVLSPLHKEKKTIWYINRIDLSFKM